MLVGASSSTSFAFHFMNVWSLLHWPKNRALIWLSAHWRDQYKQLQKLVLLLPQAYKAMQIEFVISESSREKKNAKKIVIYTQTSTYGFNLRLHAVKISITLLDSLNRQGNRFLQDGHVDIVPNIWCSGEMSNFLGNFHVFWKDRTKHCVCIFPLLVVCKAYEKLWARTNPSNWTPSYNWAYFSWDLIECNSLGFQCSLNQCKRWA